VAMPQDDYYKFIEIFEKLEIDSYSIMGPYSCKHYNSNFIKLQDENTTFIEEFVSMYPDRFGGVYIDIFPIHGLPKNNLVRKMHVYKCNVLKKFNIRLRFPYNSENSIIKKIMWILIIPIRITKPYTYFMTKLDKTLMKYKFNTSDKVFFSWRRIPRKSSTSYKNIFYYEDFIKGVDMEFEDTTISVPIGYERYLEMDFGDYMKLPPEEERISRHPKVNIDLNRGFRDYI